MVVFRQCRAAGLVYCSGSSRKRTMPADASISANISLASTILHSQHPCRFVFASVGPM